MFTIIRLIVLLICTISFFCPGNLKQHTFYSSYQVIIITVLIICGFLASSLMVFYVILEIVFISIFYFLIKIGIKIERKISSYYIFFFTVFSSLPLLSYILTSNELIKMNCLSRQIIWSNYWRPFVIFIFMVKIPTFGVHMWLPKAHVEAPLSGSILLSGTLLKIGFYGIIRFIHFTKIFINKWASYPVSLGWISALIMCTVCFRQLDIKLIVAYSSIVHMGIRMSSVFSATHTGMKGALYRCFSHGLRSPIMFYCVYLIFNCKNTRRLITSKGGNFNSPIITYAVFLVLIPSLGVPPLLPFFSEFIENIGVLLFRQHFLWLSLIIFFSCGLYLLYFFIYFFHGWRESQSTKLIFYPDLSCVTIMITLLLFTPLLLNPIL